MNFYITLDRLIIEYLLILKCHMSKIHINVTRGLKP